MTERIFEVEISNKTSKGYETATALEMPATWAEFHDALEKARIKDARDCHNELTKIEYPGIQRGMIGDNVNLYELNLLAQRLAMLSEDDRMGLDGLLQIEGGRHIGPIPLPRRDLPDTASRIPPADPFDMRCRPRWYPTVSWPPASASRSRTKAPQVADC